ncbi:MAG: HEPN domain-containing protein [Sedimenticola sp.]|nr:HEPN domain-containing protein [Sedimenticola sp.]
MSTLIHPIKEKIKLSEYLGIHLDNPRTNEEILLVEEYLKSSMSVDGVMSIPPYDDDVPENHVSLTIEEFLLAFLKYHSNDEYVREIANSYKRENIFRILASIWIIIRFDDEGSIQELKQIKKEHTDYPTVTILEDEHPLVRNERLLESYIHLLSLLTFEHGYRGISFFLAKHDEITSGFPSKRIANLFINFGLMYFPFRRPSDDPDSPADFSEIVNDLVHFAELLDNQLISEEKEKIEYVANLLKTAGSYVDDEKLKLVVLVSIVELLLTHNPNFNRFNVEDSISKQFQLKASIVIFNESPTTGISEIKKRLKTIYQQRSNIAHGNFNELSKYINNICKIEGKEEYFEDLIIDMYWYVLLILKKYLNDPEYINFLREN